MEMVENPKINLFISGQLFTGFQYNIAWEI